jgi:nucleoside phosphorylase
MSEQIDFVVVFALEKEFRAFLEQLVQYSVEETDIVFARAEIGSRTNDSVHRLIALKLPGTGNYEAATAITRAIDVWNPRFVLVGGIAGGVKRSEFELGDLILADLIVGYEPGKELNAFFESRAKSLRPDVELLGLARDLPPKDWIFSVRVPRPDGTSGRVIPRVHEGIILSGEKVIASAVRFAEISRDVDKTVSNVLSKSLAIEMEGYGAALAAFRAPTAPAFFIAKAICDWANSAKDDSWQAYAASVSAAFIAALIARVPVKAFGKKNQAQRVNKRPYSGRSKLGLCDRMGSNWEDLADYYDIPPADRAKFRRGRECQDIWEWLELRQRLGGLEDALRTIKREDLIEELIPADQP